MGDTMKPNHAHINGMDIYLVPTDKFKTIGITFNFIAKHDPETINFRALLPKVLIGATKHYPTKESLQKQLDAYYGTSLSVYGTKAGFHHIMGFYVDFVNDRFVPGGESLTENVIGLLTEIIFAPRLYGGTFKKSLVNNEKRLLEENLEDLYHDKTSYAFERFKHEMFPNEMFRHSARGMPGDFQSITPHALYDYYQDSLKHDGVSCWVVGDFNIQQMLDSLKSHFHFPERKHGYQWLDTEKKTIKKPRFISEENAVRQARLNIGFRTEIRMDHALYPAMQVANMYLGGDEHSLLFNEIREKEKLSYYIDSMYFANKGLFAVLAGVDNQKSEKATKKILSVIEHVVDGQIDESLFRDAKKHVIRKLRHRMDSLRGLRIQHQWAWRLDGDFYQPDRSIRRIENVDKHQLRKALHTLKLDTVYTLKGAEKK